MTNAKQSKAIPKKYRNFVAVPCPFCGSSDIRFVGSDEVFYARCRSCLAVGPYKRTLNEARLNWNTRA